MAKDNKNEYSRAAGSSAIIRFVSLCKVCLFAWQTYSWSSLRKNKFHLS